VSFRLRIRITITLTQTADELTENSNRSKSEGSRPLPKGRLKRDRAAIPDVCKIQIQTERILLSLAEVNNFSPPPLRN